MQCSARKRIMAYNAEKNVVVAREPVPTSEVPQVSVVIVNYNTRDFLRAAVQSVVEATVRSEVIVVDNGSQDGSVEMIEREFPDVCLVRNKTNERFAKPNNDAISIARGRYVFLLNSDARILMGSLETLLEYMEQHPDVGMCAPQLLNPDGSLQRSCRGFITPWTHCCDMLALDRLFPRSTIFARSEMTYFDHQTVREVEHAMAAAILIRREVLEQVGGFDERLTIYLNDVDLSLRVKRAGWRILFLPTAKVIHHLGKTVGQMNTQFALFDEQYQNSFYYFHKHFGRWSVIVYKLLLVVGFIPRTIYWSIIALVRPTELARHMRMFSWKSLLLGLQLWK